MARTGQYIGHVVGDELLGGVGEMHQAIDVPGSILGRSGGEGGNVNEVVPQLWGVSNHAVEAVSLEFKSVEIRPVCRSVQGRCDGEGEDSAIVLVGQIPDIGEETKSLFGCEVLTQIIDAGPYREDAIGAGARHIGMNLSG